MSHAENMQTQAVAKVLNFTFGRGLGTKRSYNLHPSVCALGASTSAPATGSVGVGMRLWLNQLFFSRLLPIKKKKQKHNCFPPAHPPSLRMCWSCEIPVVVNRQ